MTTEAPEREAAPEEAAAPVTEPTEAKEPSAEPAPAPEQFIKFTFAAIGAADAAVEMSDGIGALQMLGIAAWLDFRGRLMLTTAQQAAMQHAAMEQQARQQVMEQLRRDPKMHRVS